MVTTTDTVVFQPHIDKQQNSNYYYTTIISEDEESTHYILLYTVGFAMNKEPRRRWILIDLIEYKPSEDREETAPVVKHTQALSYIQEIRSYVGDVYNSAAQLKDLPSED